MYQQSTKRIQPGEYYWQVDGYVEDSWRYFRSWMRAHRGLTETTLDVYQGIMRAIPFRLTPAAIEHGAAALEWRRIDADSRKLHAFLRARVYGVRPLPELARQGAIWAGVFLAFGLVVAVPQDRKCGADVPRGLTRRKDLLSLPGGVNQTAPAN